MKKLKTCPSCQKRYERKVGGACPHCKTSTRARRRTATTKRTCPSCSHNFTRAKTVNNQRTCPSCAVPIHYMKSGETILLSEKDAARSIVKTLEAHLARKRGARFAFTPSEAARELTHSYEILTYAKNERQSLSLQIEPEELALMYVENALANGFHKSDSLLPIRGNIAKISHRVCRQVKSSERVNDAMASTVDYSAFMVQ